MDGSYHVASLAPGIYRLVVDAPAFQGTEALVSVQTGSVTRFDVRMELGTTTEHLNVKAITPQINTGWHKLDGVVRRDQIDALPLNGRDFLNLAML
jgi:hypothetical protein